MRKTYSREFKIQACKLVIDDNIAVPQVAEKFGIHPVMLYRWVSEYQAGGDKLFVRKGRSKSAEVELRKLKQENERLRQENEILKKAAAYFAKKPENG